MKKYLFLLLMLMSLNWAQAIETTAVPVVMVDIIDDVYIINAIGDGEVILYVNDEAVENPYVIARPEPGEESITYYVYATAQEIGKDMSESDIMPVVVKPMEGEIPDPHLQGVWIVTTNKDGDEEWRELLFDDGDFTTTLRTYYSRYGGFNPETDPRPVIPFYLVIDGIRYGAPTPHQSIDFITTFNNPVIQTFNSYTIPVGFVYFIGIVMVPYNYDMYVFAAQLYPIDYYEDPTDYIYYIKGDVDGNSIVSIADVVTMIDYLLSGNPSLLNLTNADCDYNGSVTINDVTLLIDYLLNGRW